jgi:hypothetical protein
MAALESKCTRANRRPTRARATDPSPDARRTTHVTVVTDVIEPVPAACSYRCVVNSLTWFWVGTAGIGDLPLPVGIDLIAILKTTKVATSAPLVQRSRHEGTSARSQQVSDAAFLRYDGMAATRGQPDFRQHCRPMLVRQRCRASIEACLAWCSEPTGAPTSTSSERGGQGSSTSCGWVEPYCWGECERAQPLQRFAERSANARVRSQQVAHGHSQVTLLTRS